MKFRYISSYFALMFLSLFAEQVNASILDNLYTGLAISWDHLGGKSYGVLTNHAGNQLIFSNGRSLCANRMNGYLFVGKSHNLQQLPIFTGYEFQIGQGSLSSQLDNTASDPNSGLLTGPLQRRMDPKLRRQMSASLIMRIGGRFLESLRLYGLFGIDLSHFKYSYIVENIDVMSARVNGFQTFVKTKWKTAPTLGLGIDKKIDKVRVGLEYRFASYGALQASRRVQQAAATELISIGVRPYISSIMLRLCYGV